MQLPITDEALQVPFIEADVKARVDVRGRVTVPLQTVELQSRLLLNAQPPSDERPVTEIEPASITVGCENFRTHRLREGLRILKKELRLCARDILRVQLDFKGNEGFNIVKSRHYQRTCVRASVWISDNHGPSFLLR